MRQWAPGRGTQPDLGAGGGIGRRPCRPAREMALFCNIYIGFLAHRRPLTGPRVLEKLSGEARSRDDQEHDGGGCGEPLFGDGG